MDKVTRYKKDYRQLDVYRVVSEFVKPPYDGMPIIPRTTYALGLDWPDAAENVRNMYTRGDRKYFTLIMIEKLGHPEGIHYLT
jgi:hypothetical protein